MYARQGTVVWFCVVVNATYCMRVKLCILQHAYMCVYMYVEMRSSFCVNIPFLNESCLGDKVKVHEVLFFYMGFGNYEAFGGAH